MPQQFQLSSGLQGLTPFEFKSLFTADERVAIRNAATSDPHLADWLDLVNSAPRIRLDHAMVVTGIQALESEGLLVEGRGAQILAGQAPT